VGKDDGRTRHWALGSSCPVLTSLSPGKKDPNKAKSLERQGRKKAKIEKK